jgi:dTDP-4-dehydrorhamnose reductase
MHKTILVTGANGQLGNAIRRIAPKYNEYVFEFTDVDTLDICNPAQVDGFIRTRNIRYVLNCAAYTAVDRAEDEAELCLRINRDAVHNIGRAAQAEGCRVIHVSTDYVFDGHGTRPYRESDATAPQSVYGLSKLEGEKALLKACPADAVILRSAWLYSEFGHNFVKTMLRLGREREEVDVVSDQIGTPTYAGDLAAAMLTIIEQAERAAFVPGIYHYSGQGACSWYEFASKIMTLVGLACRVRPVATGDYPTRALRPAYSVLCKEKIKQVYQVETPDWETSLGRCLRHLTDR